MRMDCSLQMLSVVAQIGRQRPTDHMPNPYHLTFPGSVQISTESALRIPGVKPLITGKTLITHTFIVKTVLRLRQNCRFIVRHGGFFQNVEPLSKIYRIIAPNSSQLLVYCALRKFYLMS